MAKGMILAAGQGTRVRPLTKGLPKPMIPILGKPVMEYLIEHLARHGITEIMVNVAYCHKMIEDYFGDGSRWGVSIGYAFEGEYDHGDIVPKPKGSAGGMKAIQDFSGFFDETTLVICGDAIVDLDIGAALFEHRSKGARASVVTLEVPNEQVQNYGIVVADQSGKIECFQEKPIPAEAKSNLASTGIYLVEPQILDLIPPGRVMDIGSELFPALVQRQLPFYQHTQDFHWLDIGRVGDYWRIVQDLMQGGMPGVAIPGHEVSRGVFVGLNAQVHWESLRVQGPVYIGSGATVAPGVTLVGPTWIGCGARVDEGATVTRSILFDYAHIGANAIARERIVSGAYCVSREGQDDGDPLPHWLGDARHTPAPGALAATR